MNKRLLILVGVVMFIFLNILKPTIVNAQEEGLVEKNSVAEGNPEGQTEGNPEGKSEGNPEGQTEGNPEGQTEGNPEGKTEGNPEGKTEGNPEGQTEGNLEGEVKSSPKAETKAAPEGETDPKMEVPTDAKADSSDTKEDNQSKAEYGQIYDIQKVKVITSKVDENGDMLAGAKLQILDKNGNVVDEWTSTTETHETQLSDGTYILHEVEAPEGYDLADDVEFIVKVEIAQLSAGVDVDPVVCTHYEDGQGNFGIVLYYVEIEGKKHEVYCINQDLGTPDSVSIYDGEILDESSIRNYTKQEVYVDAHQNTDVIDVADKSLLTENGDGLYDKVLDIIYHRNKAAELFPDLTETEIRYVTENALKNYTNAGLTRVQRVKVAAAPENYDKYDSYQTSDNVYIWYLYPWYRSFVYLPDAELGSPIYKQVVGEGDAFGNLARHWSDGHNAASDKDVRDQVYKYYQLYEYLVSDTDHHPAEMNLYIYSTQSIHTYIYHGNEYKEPYQNLLGVTGYFEDIKQQEKEVEMVDNYSTEKVEVTIKKVWNDNDDKYEKRPESITMKLSNGMTVTLNAENDWTGVIEGLPKYNEGQLIKYTWEEVDLPSGYELISTEEDNYLTTITNKYVLKNIKVTKVWADDDDDEKKRPENVTITLLANGKDYGTIILSEENEWKGEFKDLPIYDSEKEVITYTVREDNVPEGYVDSYEGDEETGFIIHNVKGQGDHEPPEENPQTGSNIVLYLITLFVSIVGLVSGKIYLKENN